jgi:UDP-2,3-diacylglucosamine pyrophosphatase LpxH
MDPAMPLFVCSDLHLGDATSARLFHDPQQGRVLAALCDEVRRREGELVLAGDIFDLTAAQPPKKGLGEFGERVGAPTIVDRSPRGLSAILGAMRENNPIACGAIERLAADRPVTLVAGNHDRHLLEPGAGEAMRSAGLGGVRIEATAVWQLGERVVSVQHGHAFDPSNAEPNCGGEVMTSVLHHAVIPLLRQLGKRKNVAIDADRIVALRPEERVVPVLERWLSHGQFSTFLDAFVEILVANDYLSRVVSWLVTSERIRERLKTDDDLWEQIGDAALEGLEGRRPLPGRPPPPDLLVLGHTHVIDWAVQEGLSPLDARTGRKLDPIERLYVNLGTWSARAVDAAGPLDPTMPVLQIAGGGGRLSASLSDLASGQRLQQFEVER